MESRLEEDLMDYADLLLRAMSYGVNCERQLNDVIETLHRHFNLEVECNCCVNKDKDECCKKNCCRKYDSKTIYETIRKSLNKKDEEK